MTICRQKIKNTDIPCENIQGGEIFEYKNNIYMAIDYDHSETTIDKLYCGDRMCGINLETGCLILFEGYERVKQLIETDDYEFTVYTNAN